MPAKFSKEVRQRIYELHTESKPVREILTILKSEGIKISDKSIYNIIKENEQNKVKNQSFVSIEVDDTSFNESFGEEVKTNEGNIKEDLFSLINQGIKEGTEEVKSILFSKGNDKENNGNDEDNNDRLDKLINETKKKVNKPVPVNKILHIVPFNTDGLTEEEKRLRRDMIIKIRNYIDCFSDNEIILSMCGNPLTFKQKLYEKDLANLTIIYEEIQIGINQSKDFEQFMYMFSSGLQIAEFVSSILLGMNITGLKDELLNEISEFDLRQLACELSLSRYISPQKRIMLITLKVLLKKILSNDLLGKHKDLKLKLAGYYNSMTKFLGK